jgi:hypothetical protein
VGYDAMNIDSDPPERNDLPSEVLGMWTVFDHPSDFPHCFVARLALVSRGAALILTEDIVTADTLCELRRLLPPGLIRIERHPNDDAKIVEIWL